MAQSALCKFDFRLTSEDEKILKAFSTLLKLDDLTDFSSDDFRRYGLDRFIVDKVHGIGGLFAKLKHQGLIIEVGTIHSTLASNHSRTIRLYQWTPTEDSI